MGLSVGDADGGKVVGREVMGLSVMTNAVVVGGDVGLSAATNS